MTAIRYPAILRSLFDQRRRSLLVCGFIAVTSSLVSFVPARSAVLLNGPPSGGPYVCADVAGDSNAPSNKVQAWSCHAGPNQQFALESGVSSASVIPGGLIIFALGGTMCVSAPTFAQGSAITIEPCANPWTGAIWQYTIQGQLQELHNLQQPLCLDATNGQDGTQLMLNSCNSNTNSQQWTIE